MNTAFNVAPHLPSPMHRRHARGCILNGARSVDQRQVAQPLREVPEQLAARRVDLLGEEPDVVRVREDLLHRLAGLVDPAEPRERLDEPEGARDERALLPDVLARAVEEPAAAREPLADRVDGAAEALRARDSPSARRAGPPRRATPRPAQPPYAPSSSDQQRSSIQACSRSRCSRHCAHVAVGQLPVRGEAERAVERHPDRDLRARVVAMLVELPDARSPRPARSIASRSTQPASISPVAVVERVARRET